MRKYKAEASLIFDSKILALNCSWIPGATSLMSSSMLYQRGSPQDA